MSLYEICERCGERTPNWLMHQTTLHIGELNRAPRLCDQCVVTVMSVLLDILRPNKSRPASSLPMSR